MRKSEIKNILENGWEERRRRAQERRRDNSQAAKDWHAAKKWEAAKAAAPEKIQQKTKSL